MPRVVRALAELRASRTGPASGDQLEQVACTDVEIEGVVRTKEVDVHDVWWLKELPAYLPYAIAEADAVTRF